MRKTFFTAAIAIFAVVLMLLAHFGARLTMTAPTFSFAAQAREVYLTFDDGPSEVVTNRILDTLQKEQVKATFFVVGDRVWGRENTLRRIAAEGHTLGVHSQTHRYGEIYAGDDALLRDAAACAATISRVAGVTPRVYRFPGGGHFEKRALLEREGYRVVWWNAVCGDEETRNASAQTLFETAVATAQNKDPVVLLLHDSAPHAATAEALPAIIAHFKAEGCVFCQF